MRCGDPCRKTTVYSIICHMERTRLSNINVFMLATENLVFFDPAFSSFQRQTISTVFSYSVVTNLGFTFLHSHPIFLGTHDIISRNFPMERDEKDSFSIIGK
mmetsp:Transcript_28761/g.80412  ORF Transcript_28761/g.80412 Transcript_28761/m.80412 type:complete len:102 (-) Transcript_28761:685-990(-)